MSLFAVGARTIYIAAKHTVIIKQSDELNANSSVIEIPAHKSGTQMLVKSITVSNDETHLAVITWEKCLLIFDCKTLMLLKLYTLPRAISRVRFSQDNSKLLIADKTGDAYSYDWQKTSAGCVKILSHLSLLLDVLMTPSLKYVISCDRDEKIRVSNYPNTYNIQSYCLGHEEFVVSIDLLPHNLSILVSSSGDGTIRLWDYVTGEALSVINCNAAVHDKSVIEDYIQNLEKEGFEVNSLPVWKQSCCILNNTSSLIAVSLYSWKYIIVYEIKCNNLDSPQIFMEVPITDMNIDFVVMNNSLWVFYLAKGVIEKWSLSNPLCCLRKLKISDDFIPPLSGDDGHLLDSVNITTLYKRRFDNVQEYQERKKQRMIQSNKI